MRGGRYRCGACDGTKSTRGMGSCDNGAHSSTAVRGGAHKPPSLGEYKRSNAGRVVVWRWYGAHMCNERLRFFVTKPRD